MRFLVAAAALLLLAGCSSGQQDQPDQPRSLTPIPSPNVTTTTSKPAPTSTVPSAAPTPGAAMGNVAGWVEDGASADAGDFHVATREGVRTELGEYVAFVTPSGKTKCMTDEISDGALACLITLANPPPRPADSYGEWVSGWVDFDGTSAQVGSLRADPGQFSLGTGAELGYGDTLKFGEFQCRSDPDGLYCVNFAHQTAVRLSDAGVQPFGCLREVDAPQGIGTRFACP